VDRRRFLLTALAGALGTPLAVGAQPARKVRIGVLSTADGPEWEVSPDSADSRLEWSGRLI
jgi:hypothetical protein